MLPSEETVEEMVVKLLSVWTVLPSEETVEEMVVKLLSVWTVLPSEERLFKKWLSNFCQFGRNGCQTSVSLDGAPLRRDC